VTEADDERIRTTSASRARDHLANERTWLAWVRTALGLVALGAAVARFSPDQGARNDAAAALIVAIGLAALAFGTYRYRVMSDELEAGYFLTGSRGRTVVIAAALMLIVLVVALVLVL
jgi:putative membrane protein